MKKYNKQVDMFKFNSEHELDGEKAIVDAMKEWEKLSQEEKDRMNENFDKSMKKQFRDWLEDLSK